MASFDDLRELTHGLSYDEILDLVESLPNAYVEELVDVIGAEAAGKDIPRTLIEQAHALEPAYVSRPHLEYISERVTAAIDDVEAGKNRMLVIEMPPRSGKTMLGSQVLPGWLISTRSSKVVLASHDGGLATSWGRQIRRWVEQGKLGDGINIARDAGAAGEWETEKHGALKAVSIRESLTGRGANVMIIDDPHKDFIDAHSATMRENVWNWWLSVAQLRLEPPYLVVVIMTRWHEDDFVGRLLSTEYEGNPDDWEVIRLPALAEKNDVLGRKEGEPLLSPLLAETREEAIVRWAQTRANVGEYVWSAMYQQRPAPAKGSIFNPDHFRYWTTIPGLVEDESVIFLDEDLLRGGEWVDSWDMAFKGTTTSDYVVGQRWVRSGAFRILIDQQRGKWTFTQSLDAMEKWGDGKGPYGDRVHRRLVEEAANGAAIIDSVKKKITGVLPRKATVGKEARARAITPEIEAKNVILPHPKEPGYEWVLDLISEIRNFPHDVHDDQVDAMTQALLELRDEHSGDIRVPTERGVVGGSRIPSGYGRRIRGR